MLTLTKILLKIYFWETSNCANTSQVLGVASHNVDCTTPRIRGFSQRVGPSLRKKTKERESKSEQ